MLKGKPTEPTSAHSRCIFPFPPSEKQSVTLFTLVSGQKTHPPGQRAAFGRVSQQTWAARGSNLGERGADEEHLSAPTDHRVHQFSSLKAPPATL